MKSEKRLCWSFHVHVHVTHYNYNQDLKDTNMAFYVSKHTRQEQYRINQRRKYTLSLASLRQLQFGTSARTPI